MYLVRGTQYLDVMRIIEDDDDGQSIPALPSRESKEERKRESECVCAVI